MVLDTLVNDLFEINRGILFSLWNLASVNSVPQGSSQRLIFPRKRDGSIRVNEQESWILYCKLLDTLNYYYSIETPTEHLYQQSGEGCRSASSDLSLYVYEGQKFDKVANVEFKFNNPAKEEIRKDIEKIIREEITGNWFHTLKNINSNTFSSLFDKFIYSFKDCSSLIEDNKETSILFCFCVLDKRWGCIKHFSYSPSQRNFENYVKRFFHFDYTIKAGKIEVADKNDWSLVLIDHDV